MKKLEFKHPFSGKIGTIPNLPISSIVPHRFMGILSVMYLTCAAGIAATIAIFVFSRLYKNSSFYDAYWSVIPPLIALYWLLEATASGVDTTRAWLVVILVGQQENEKHLLEVKMIGTLRYLTEFVKEGGLAKKLEKGETNERNVEVFD